MNLLFDVKGSKQLAFHPRTLILLTICTLIAVGCFIFGNNHFGAYDLSMLVDVSYRQYIGQVPYRDFICTLPPMFYLIGKYAFFLFGVQWNAFVFMNMILAVSSFLLTYMLLRALGQEYWISLLLSLTSISCTFLIVPFPWHSTITTSVGLCCVLAAILSIRNPDKTEWLVICAVLFAALTLLKPNTAFPLCIGVFTALLWLYKPRKRILWAFFISIFISVVFLFVNRVNLQDVIHSYIAISYRAFPNKFLPPDLQPNQQILYLWWMILALLPVSYLLLRSKLLYATWKNEWSLLLFCIVCGFYGWGTNWDPKQVDSPLIIVPSILMLIELLPSLTQLLQTKKPEIQKLFSSSPTQQIGVYLCVLFLFCLTLSMQAVRTQLTGARVFYETTSVSLVHAPDHFFTNMMEGPRLQHVLLQVDQITNHHKSPVFFGPRMEFCYAVFKQYPPKNLPIWWHPGTSYALAQEANVLRVWENNRRKTLIFLRNDHIRVPNVIMEDIRQNYIKDNSFSELTVYKLKHSHAQY